MNMIKYKVSIEIGELTWAENRMSGQILATPESKARHWVEKKKRKKAKDSCNCNSPFDSKDKPIIGVYIERTKSMGREV